MVRSSGGNVAEGCLISAEFKTFGSGSMTQGRTSRIRMVKEYESLDMILVYD